MSDARDDTGGKARLPYARSFRDLVVYRKQRELSREMFRLSRSFPLEERFSLTDQIRRSARSIGAQIAEAWAKRRYEKHSVAKLTDADGEQMETQHWLETATDDGYLSRENSTRLVGLCEEIGRLLGSMIAKSTAFCESSDHLREDPSPYFCAEPPDFLPNNDD
jgi:four helix bundle protein